MAAVKTILIAEPMEIFAFELRSFISDKGFNIIKVKTLKEMLLAIQEQVIDVLVLNASLLKEDCGFISIIKGMIKDLPILYARKVILLNSKAKYVSRGYFFII